MSKVIFDFNQIETIIQCDENETMKKICSKYASKIQKELKTLIFMYSGKTIDLSLSFKKTINNFDKEKKSFKVLVKSIIDTYSKGNNNLIKSKQSICPKCSEIAKIAIQEYKINSVCRLGHGYEILISKYKESQKIDQSKIICNSCKDTNKANTYQNMFHRCNTCKINICPLCITKHDKFHNIINYDDKNFICEEHSEFYNSYCKSCQKNLCIECEKFHKTHKTETFGNIIPDKNKLIKDLAEYKNILKQFDDGVKAIINKLEQLVYNMKILFEINEDILNNYINFKSKRNYEIISNINEFQFNNNNFIKILQPFIQKKDNYNEIPNLLNIYDKMVSEKINNNNGNFEYSEKSLANDNNLKFASTLTQNQIQFDENNTNKYIIKKEVPTQNLNNINGQSLDNNENINNNLEEAHISQINTNQDYHEISTNRISESEFNELLIQYPLIEDGIIIEKRNPQENKFERIIYYGEWDINKNVKHGRGIQIWQDGAKYLGYWKDGKANGKGKFYHADGDIYEGNWSDDKPNGYGIYTHADGTRYEGEWKNDKQNGKGKEYWPDGSIYEGQYIDGKKNGKGVYAFPDGAFYIGNFKDNNINGEGIYTFSDKRKYEGSWVNNRMEGKGVYTWSDGRKYEGEYVNDKKEGYGIFTWPNGKIYKGYWKNGKQEGEGQFYTPSDKKWKKGIWKEGKRIKWIESDEKDSDTNNFL